MKKLDCVNGANIVVIDSVFDDFKDIILSRLIVNGILLHMHPI